MNYTIFKLMEPKPIIHKINVPTKKPSNTIKLARIDPFSNQKLSQNQPQKSNQELSPPQKLRKGTFSISKKITFG